jgi:hypothetical protein
LASTPGGRGGGLGGTGGAQVEAEAGAVEDHPVQDAHEDREEDQAVDLADVRAEVDAGNPAGLLHDAGRVVVADLHTPDVVEGEVADEAGGDRVEHDRRDDLAHSPG